MSYEHIKNVLILEDDPRVADPYMLALENAGFFPFHASSIKDLRSLISRVAFCGAYIDIRLDESNETNTDGLIAMSILKETSDETVCIVVTGYGNFDIARASLKDYEAYDIRKKENTDYEVFIDILKRGLVEKQSEKIDGHALMRALAGKDFVFKWEEMIVSELKPKAGIKSIYNIVPRVLMEAWPFLVENSNAVLIPSDKQGVVIGRMWSRSYNKMIFSIFGQSELINEVSKSGEIFLNQREYVFDKVLFEQHDANLKGILVASKEQTYPDGWVELKLPTF